MKKIKYLFLMPLLMAFQCEEEELHSIENDSLYTTKLIGGWEIESESTNGISDMTPKCCLFVDFYIDSNPDDNKGDYRYSDNTGVYNGGFTVNQTDDQIVFDNLDNQQLIYAFSVDESGENLSFTFTEDDVEILQYWVKTY